MKYTNEELATMMGESGFKKATSIKCPFIKFNGKKGNFSIMTLDAKGNYNEPVLMEGQTLEGTIIGVRQQLGLYIQKGKTGISISSTEYDSPNEKIKLFEYVGETKTL